MAMVLMIGLLGFLLDAAARALIRLAAPGRMRVPA
jgi:ABC-type nitrate/sulfonate/bicarbonate transport system permease component